MIEGKPTTYNSTWNDIEGKPTIYDSTWEKVTGKPSEYPTSWELIKGKPIDLTTPSGPAEYDDTELRGLIQGKAELEHKHTMYDIQGIDSNLTTMLIDYMSKYALSDHSHTIRKITGLSEYLDRKSEIGHRHKISEIDNLQNVIDSNMPNMSGYATTTALTRGLESKQNILTAGNNINISGDTISATEPELSGYATTTQLAALTTGLNSKQNTLTAGNNISISGKSTIKKTLRQQRDNIFCEGLKHLLGDLRKIVHHKHYSRFQWVISIDAVWNQLIP
jgi:hypothetical protein